ncbi:hypothetical protein PANT_26c00073 [Moesziomyces antarcticus T-34]|uniref:Uncharacterized protein n=1 Tax=Pseudozyma antarctica (strain T-34) TaxID=1151754 RepID=M9MJ12_PSEA3|nr:hypothetical protein PANT_26c00073 [Moesziomyces antarcticus T-34]
MAFVHHQPRQQRRDRADDSHHQTHAPPHHRHERQVDQDWSIVFPGRARQAPASPASPTLDAELSDDSNPLALTLPPLHDGTGRFIASPLSPSSTDLASTDAPSNYTNDDGHLSDARHSEDIFPDSVFSGTDSQLDADEELGFGSGSDFDFESDAAASSSHHPGRSPARRATGAPRTTSRRRPSRLSLASHLSIDSDDDDDDGTTPSHSHLLGSKACAAVDPATSALFANDKRVRGEEPDDGSGCRLTEAALLQRGSASMRGAGSPALMEPTTMEALSAFVNTMVMPVPMPLRLLGALFGWSGIWTSSNPANKVDRDEEGARASGEAEEERKYRYERLLSAQQAKAWSQRYRGILFANVDDEQPSPDVPELWRGEEHPAIAAQHVYD